MNSQTPHTRRWHRMYPRHGYSCFHLYDCMCITSAGKVWTDHLRVIAISSDRGIDLRFSACGTTGQKMLTGKVVEGFSACSNTGTGLGPDCNCS